MELKSLYDARLLLRFFWGHIFSALADVALWLSVPGFFDKLVVQRQRLSVAEFLGPEIDGMPRAQIRGEPVIQPPVEFRLRRDDRFAVRDRFRDFRKRFRVYEAPLRDRASVRQISAPRRRFEQPQSDFPKVAEFRRAVRG
jgi:hypothetical protein